MLYPTNFFCLLNFLRIARVLVAKTNRLPTRATAIVFCPVLASLSLLVMVVACPSVTTTLYGPKVSVELSGLVICMSTV